MWAKFGASRDLKPEATRIFNSAKRRGEITPQPCEICGEAKTEGHHDDYAKPLDVRWLCKLHHMWLHHYGSELPHITSESHEVTQDDVARTSWNAIDAELEDTREAARLRRKTKQSGPATPSPVLARDRSN